MQEKNSARNYRDVDTAGFNQQCRSRPKTLARMTAQELIEDIASARPGHMVGAQQRVDQLRADLGPRGRSPDNL